MSRKIREVAADEFSAHCLALIDEVIETGEEIIVTKSGKAVARVAPIAGVPSLRGSVLYQGDLISPVIDLPDEDDPADKSAATSDGVRRIFGAREGSIQTRGDILGPDDDEWNARK